MQPQIISNTSIESLVKNSVDFLFFDLRLSYVAMLQVLCCLDQILIMLKLISGTVDCNEI